MRRSSRPPERWARLGHGQVVAAPLCSLPGNEARCHWLCAASAEQHPGLNVGEGCARARHGKTSVTGSAKLRDIVDTFKYMF